MFKYSSEFKNKIMELVKDGRSVSLIVREFRVTGATVHKWVKDITDTKIRRR